MFLMNEVPLFDPAAEVQPDILLGHTSSSSLTSLLTSDDTREAHSFLESDQY